MCRPIVLVEYDHTGIGERFFEFENVSYICSANRTDRLVAVANCEIVSVLVSGLEDNVVLCMVGGLIFVDQNMLETFLIVA